MVFHRQDVQTNELASLPALMVFQPIYSTRIQHHIHHDYDAYYESSSLGITKQVWVRNVQEND